MSSLYQIDQAIMNCCDPETGEILNVELLESLCIERSQKIENVVCWIKNLQADVLALKAERESFEKREREANAKIESLKKWLANALEGEKFSTSKCVVSFRKSVRIEVTDPESVPKEFMVETVTCKPDANAIKAVLKSGREVSGCRLVENMNAQIR